MQTTVSGWPDDVRSAFLTRTSARAEPSATPVLLADLVRTSGTPGSGTYQGTVYVPSSASGQRRVSSIGDVEPDWVSTGSFTTERDPRADGLPSNDQNLWMSPRPGEACGAPSRG